MTHSFALSELNTIQIGLKSIQDQSLRETFTNSVEVFSKLFKKRKFYEAHEVLEVFLNRNKSIISIELEAIVRALILLCAALLHVDQKRTKQSESCLLRLHTRLRDAKIAHAILTRADLNRVSQIELIFENQ
jgi:hypothetical protein